MSAPITASALTESQQRWLRGLLGAGALPGAHATQFRVPPRNTPAPTMRALERRGLVQIAHAGGALLCSLTSPGLELALEVAGRHPIGQPW